MQEKTPESRSPDEDTGIRAADATLLAGALDITLDASLVKKKKRSEFPKRVIDLAEQMITMMQDHEPLYKPPKNLQAFLIETDLMLRLDKIPPEEILSVLEWTLCDNFWKGKIFKPNPAKYLRDKFLTLRNTMSPPAIKKERKFAPTSNDARALEERKEHKKNAL
jgi:hypothetical protein